jgi:hypothetical protein
MNSDSHTVKGLEKKLIKLAFLLGFIAIAVLLILRQYNIAVGLLIGTLVSIVNFKLLTRDVIKKASEGAGKLFLIISGGYLLRYGLMAAVLIIAAKKGHYYFLGAAAGLFTIRIAIFIDTFFISKWKPAKS